MSRSTDSRRKPPLLTGRGQPDEHVVVEAAAGNDEVTAGHRGFDRVGPVWIGGDLAEQTVRLVIRPRSVIERVLVAGADAVAKRQAP